MTEVEPLLVAQGVSKRFDPPARLFRKRGPSTYALRDVSLSLRPGETVGNVGESGSGKTTLGRVLVRLSEPTTASVRFLGRDLSTVSRGEVRSWFRPRIRMVFQDPDAVLNPGYTVGTGLVRALAVHKPETSPEHRQLT